jgi:hypothetical protein
VADISLDLSSPLSDTYRDLLIINGDLVLTSDVNSAGTQFIQQDLEQRLKVFQGEWFLNTTIGVPYYQTLFRKGVQQQDVDSAIQKVITSTPGIQRLITYTPTYTTANRLAKISFTAATIAGMVSYTGALNTPNFQVNQ